MLMTIEFFAEIVATGSACWATGSGYVCSADMVFDATDTRAELGSSRTDSLPSTSDNTPTLLKISISAPAPARDSLASLSQYRQ